MKRILGPGYVKKIDTLKGDFLIDKIGPSFSLHFELKVPEYFIHIFSAYGNVTIKNDLVNEFYTPTYFYKQNGTKVNDKEANDLNTRFRNYYRFLSNFHDKLSKEGILSEQLAYLLPFGIFVTIFWTPVINDFLSFLTDNLASSIPERKEISQALLAYFKENFPTKANVFLQEFSRYKLD